MMIEQGAGEWFELSQICGLTGQSPNVVAGILYRLRDRRWLIAAGVDPGLWA